MAQRPGGESKPQPGGGKALRRALWYLRAFWRDAAGALGALVMVSAANLVAPQMIRLAIDGGIAHRRRNDLILAVLGLVAVALVRGVFNFLQGFLAERASQGVAYDLRNALFAQIERLSFSYYDRVEAGQLLTRVTNDVEQIRTFAGSGVVQLASALVMLLGSTVLLLLLNWQLALVALATIPPLFLLLFGFVRRIGPLFGQVQQMLGRLNGVLQEDLAGIRVIRAFSREEYETARYKAVNDELLDKNLQTIRVFSNNFPFVFFFANLGTLAVIWFGGWQVIGGAADGRLARRLQHLPRLPALPHPHDRLPGGGHLPRRGERAARLRRAGRAPRCPRRAGRRRAARDHRARRVR